ncbi:TPA: hypothetical protein MC769_003142 [Klebsiella aerogenes]|nr:hypothetical protein [Klebsiella aerogenes]
METIKIISPDGREGTVELDDGPILGITGDVSLGDIANDIRRLRPNSAMGTVNNVETNGYFVLRSAELVGWAVEWPTVEGGDESDDQYGYEPDDDVIVN